MPPVCDYVWQVLQFLQGTPGWSEATVDEYLQVKRT